MEWVVRFHNDFEPEFDTLEPEVQDELLAHAKLLQKIGPSLGRPHVDTLKGSNYTNMKELRFSLSGAVWRVAFAFDSKREAILLVAGNKSGVSQAHFYRSLIKKADQRFASHLGSLKI